MSIRIRLLLSFTSVVVVSVILFVLTAYLLSVAVTGDFRSISSFYNIHYALHPLSDEEETIFLDMKYLAKNDPGQLKDQSLLAEYDAKLKMVQAGLVVRNNDKLIYQTPSFKKVDWETALPTYEMDNYSIRNTLNVESRFFSYAKFDFYYNEETGDKGSVYVIRERSPFAEIVRTLLPLLVGIFLLILLLTGVVLYRYVTRKVVQPLERLRLSAEHIKGGDLAFELHASSRDEIGQLVQSFEQMRQRLHESVQLQLRYEENRKQLLSNISHDLRTPITTIKGYAEGILDGVTNTPEKLQRYAGAIHTRATDMERLVEELLLYSKLDLNKEPFNFEKVELNRFVRHIADELSLEFDNKQVELRYLIGSESQTFDILADCEKLKRVFLNLFDNSLKYMVHPPKRITIGFERQDQMVRVELTDNGPGIGTEALPYVFDRFYRQEPSRSPAGGSGLGLAIAKQIIEGHGGSIWARSEPGNGTSIYFTLKIYEDRR